MAKVISQETYDEVIKENIVEFSMSVADAREESIKQFEAQGINLANIIKDMNINELTGVPVMNEVIDSLKAHAEKTKVLDVAELDRQLSILMSELNKSIGHRVQASKIGTHHTLLQIMEWELQQSEHLKDSVS